MAGTDEDKDCLETTKFDNDGKKESIANELINEVESIDQSEITKTDKSTIPTSCESNDDIETVKRFEEMFKNRFTDLDPDFLPYKCSNDAQAIPIVKNFPPPWNSQNRRDAFRGRGHDSRHHHQQNRYKRRHDEYDNRQHRGSYHSNYHQDQRHYRQDQYHGNRQHYGQSNYDGRGQGGYRRY